MSQVIFELNQIAERIVVIASSQLTLSKTLETLTGLVLQMDHHPKASAQLEWAQLAQGPIRTTASINYAQRSQLALRLHFLGTTTSLLASQGNRITQLADGMILNLNPEDSTADELIRWTASETSLQAIPVILTGLEEALANPSHPGHLRAVALLRWSQRRIPNLKYLDKLERFFEDSLEWVLSY